MVAGHVLRKMSHWRYEGLPVCGRFHRSDQVFPDARLDDITQSSRLLRSINDFRIVLYRTDHHSRAHWIRSQCFGDLYPVEPWHFKIQDDYVGSVTADAL